MRKRAKILVAVVVLIGCAELYFWQRSFVLRDEMSILRQHQFTLASDRGLFQVAVASCNVGTLMQPTAYAVGLKEGSPTVYSQHLQMRWRTMARGWPGHLTLDHLGFDTYTLYTYAGFIGAGEPSEAGSKPLTTQPLVNHVLAVTIPYWALLLLTIFPLCFWWISPRRKRAIRRASGLCEQCGYDLRATPARCPECGATAVDVGAT